MSQLNDERLTERRPSYPALGVGTPLGFGIDAPGLVAYAEAADQAGLDDVSVGELRNTEVFSLASAMISKTQHVRVETSIVAAVTRAPTLLAMAAATLSQLSNGRFCLGVGAGSPIVAGWHGADFAAPLSKVDWTIRIIRRVLAAERIDELGSFKLASEMLGQVPLIISAMNTKMLQLAGRLGDGVVLQFCGPEQLSRMAEIARGERRASRMDKPFEVIANVWGYAGEDRELAVDTFRKEVGPYLAVPTYRAAAVALSSESAVDAAAEAWRAGGRDAAAAAIPDSMVDKLLFVLGDDDVPARLEAYARAGCDRIRFIPLTPVRGDTGHAHAVVDAVAALRHTVTMDTRPGFDRSGSGRLR